MNKEIIETIKSTKTVDELKEVAAKKGYVLNDEEAKGYFDMYHTSGKINEKELDNVAGGLCRGGKQYSSDAPYKLITTIGNHCSLHERTEETKGELIWDHCANCKYYDSATFFTKYCNRRTFNDDPLNPAKVK